MQRSVEVVDEIHCIRVMHREIFSQKCYCLEGKAHVDDLKNIIMVAWAQSWLRNSFSRLIATRSSESES